MVNQCKRKTIRKSGIELLKIMAVFLIVISHVTQTLSSPSSSVDFHEYFILLENATTDIQVIMLMLLRQAGALGNTIFFVCSAWFLVDRKEGGARKKAFLLLSTVWVCSILILCLYLSICPSCLTLEDIVKQIFPTCFANNWYMTCYIIFLFIYPWLNELINIIDQKQLLRIVLFSSFLWIIMDYIKGDLFFPSSLILWVTIYFIIAYLKIYCNQTMMNLKVGIILVITGILGTVAQVIITNYVGLYFITVLSNKVLRWNSNSCPFYIMIAIGSIIIALKMKFKVRFINYISSLSMFVYLISENHLFRMYTRPAIWQYIYINYGYSEVVLLDFIFAFLLFFATTIVSLIYKETIQRVVTVVSMKIYIFISKIYSHVEENLLKLK